MGIEAKQIGGRERERLTQANETKLIVTQEAWLGAPIYP